MVNRALEEILLANFSLDEILELNDLTEEDVIALLFENGLVKEPENLIREFENEDD